MMQNYSQQARLIMGVVFAPFVGVAAGVLVAAVNSALTSPDHFSWVNLPGTLVVLLLGSIYVGATAGFAASLVLGLPMHALLMRLGLVSVWPYAVCGAAAGIAACVAWFVVMPAQTDLPDTATLLLAVFMGIVSASTFWLIRRPDRDQPSPAGSKDSSA